MQPVLKLASMEIANETQNEAKFPKLVGEAKPTLDKVLRLLKGSKLRDRAAWVYLKFESWLQPDRTFAMPSFNEFSKSFNISRWSMQRVCKLLVDEKLLTIPSPGIGHLPELPSYLDRDPEPADVVTNALRAPTMAPIADQTSSQPAEPAAPIVGPAKKAKGNSGKKGKKEPLSAELITKICSSVENMSHYLSFGAESLDLPREVLISYPRAAAYFLDYNDDEAVAKWTVVQLSGYFWIHIAMYRTRMGLPIQMPPFAELGQRIKRMLDTTSGLGWTRLMVKRHIEQVYRCFGLLKQVSGSMGLEYDMSSLTHQFIRSKMDHYATMSNEEISEAIAFEIEKRNRLPA